MHYGILALLCLALLFLGSAGAADYRLCDSIEKMPNADKIMLVCNITSTKFNFTQASVDGFWEDLEQDPDYMWGDIDTVQWKIESVVLQVRSDISFAEPVGMNVAWDLFLEGDSNTTFDFNQAAAVTRTANQTAIKKAIGSMQDYSISFAPMEGRRGMRNISLEKPEGALAVYIQGGLIKNAELDIEGDLWLSGAYLENFGKVRARNINLLDGAYISGAGFIEAENVELEGASFLRNVGSLGRAAIDLENSTSGLVLKEKSYIDGLTGGIETTADVYLDGESRIDNIGRIQSDAIQWIYANNLVLKDGSSIKGFGGSPGEIMLATGLVLENSKIFGKQGNSPSGITAASISMDNNSVLSGFLKAINVTGKETFLMESGASIENFSGKINSCAPLSMDGNATRIVFATGGTKTIIANSLALDNGATIQCAEQADCNYTFSQQSCGAMPIASLDISGQTGGNAPLSVNFIGSCEVSGPVAECTINFGDGSPQENFDGSATHVYENAGNFEASLVATTMDGLTAQSRKTVAVEQDGVPVEVQPLVLLSAQTIQQGGEITIFVECNSAIEFVSIESDFGALPVAGFPKPCPAEFGPVAIPEGTPAGTHMVTVSTVTTGGLSSAQELYLLVEQKAPTSWLPFELDGFALYAIVGLVVVVAAILAILVVLKKRKVPKMPKIIAEKPLLEQGKKAAENGAKGPGGEKTMASDFVSTPPWMAAPEGNGNGEKQEPAAKEAGAKPVAEPAKETPAAAAVPEKTADEEIREKQAVFGAGNQPEQGETRGQGAKQPEGRVEKSGESFDELVERVKGRGLGKAWQPKASAKENSPGMPGDNAGRALASNQEFKKPAAGLGSVQEKVAEMRGIAGGNGEKGLGLVGNLARGKKKPEEKEEGQKKGEELPPWLKKGE